MSIVLTSKENLKKQICRRHFCSYKVKRVVWEVESACRGWKWCQLLIGWRSAVVPVADCPRELGTLWLVKGIWPASALANEWQDPVALIVNCGRLYYGNFCGSCVVIHHSTPCHLQHSKNAFSQPLKQSSSSSVNKKGLPWLGVWIEKRADRW